MLDKARFARYNAVVNSRRLCMADIRFSRLWDVYSPLLTPTQREITDMFFNLDLTVSEIAEQKGISRQGVSECLSSAKKLLEEYESKLSFSRLLRAADMRLALVVRNANGWADDFLASNPQFAGEVSRLKGLLSGDYAAEADALCAKTDAADGKTDKEQ